MVIQSILAATDFSPLADQAVERAGLLARDHNAVLHLLYVQPPISWQSFGRALVEHPLITEKQLYDAAKERLASVAETCRNRHAITVQAEVDIGRAHECIAVYVNKHNIGLTVLGPHTGNAAKDLFIGSTALKTLHGCTAPVLVAQENPPASYRTVLVAIDFSENSQRVIEVAEQIAPQAQLHALHVYDVLFEGKMRYAGVDDDVIQHYINAAGVEATYMMEEFLARQGRHDTIASNVRHGHPSRTIIDEAQVIQADLIVMGKHSRTGVENLMLGSVAEGVLYGLDRDLLVITASAT